MSASHRRSSRAASRLALRASLVLAALPFILGVAGRRASPRPSCRPASRASAPADAERSGSTIRLPRPPVGGSTLVEVEPPSGGMSLLAVSPDGDACALADQVGELSGSLTLADADGSQLRHPAARAARRRPFAPDASWLAVVDGRGALWRVDAASGRSQLSLADGPFIGLPR